MSHIDDVDDDRGEEFLSSIIQRFIPRKLHHCPVLCSAYSRLHNIHIREDLHTENHRLLVREIWRGEEKQGEVVSRYLTMADKSFWIHEFIEESEA